MKRAEAALLKFALGRPGAEEDVACAGTAIESRTAKVRTKAFLFLRPGTAMVKLKESLPEAKRMAAEDPDRCKAGATGWVTAATDLPAAVLKRWIDESYRLMAPKRR